MSLEKHVKIIFENIKIENNIDFFQLWKETFQKILIQNAKEFPIRQIDFDNKKDKSRHDQMVVYVDTMLELNKELQKAITEHETNQLQRQINATDKKIDKLVYKLYDLTPEEIKIVEESIK